MLHAMIKFHSSLSKKTGCMAYELSVILISYPAVRSINNIIESAPFMKPQYFGAVTIFISEGILHLSSVAIAERAPFDPVVDDIIRKIIFKELFYLRFLDLQSLIIRESGIKTSPAFSGIPADRLRLIFGFLKNFLKKPFGIAASLLCKPE
ncbi:MAG: hypothetical protein BWY61_01839 [Firmicutes bacterium ADurb.Bin354]|nr:MAG: hypothetical protein BWY61_01839 [Firmicutes bacterium ADurb.Bin354]